MSKLKTGKDVEQFANFMGNFLQNRYNSLYKHATPNEEEDEETESASTANPAGKEEDDDDNDIEVNPDVSMAGSLSLLKLLL